MNADMSLPTLLRTATSHDHHQAERGQLQQELVTGKVSQATYRNWLEQMQLVHEAVEMALPAVAACGESEATLAQFLVGKSDLLQADLNALGGAERPEPLPATRAFQARLADLSATQPRALVGVFYVLEGSTNGNRFIAKRMRGAFTGAEEAIAYLDPYGDEQPAKWSSFRAALGAIPVGADAGDITDAARHTFIAVQQIGEEIVARQTV